MLGGADEMFLFLGGGRLSTGWPTVSWSALMALWTLALLPPREYTPYAWCFSLV
jgi:hypothetical protein